MERYFGPCRSVLYIPGSKPRALEKATSLPADAIIFDLEDAVSPDEKGSARETLSTALKTSDFGARRRIVRINGFDTIWGAEDLKMLTSTPHDAVLLPKVEQLQTVERAFGALGEAAKIWAMMETPRGILNAAGLAQAPGMEGFVMGTNDLAKELGSRGRAAMLTSLQHCLLAARAEGLICVDGVYNAFKDEEGLHAECEEGRDMGFDGKTLIHPAQLAIANQVFGPSEAELELAQRQIEAFEQAQAGGQGVAVVDGKIVENLHVETAQRLLRQAEVIAQMEA
ncbi:MAG: CoA ester lyase [Litoreibacter sp.]|nr:CoA ester lyase [Litoreibacter sp.]